MVIMKSYNHPFPPILNADTHILFLGSFPSLTSFEYSFYYAHKSNLFWPIMETIFDLSLPDREAKINFCLTHQIGLWDVIGSCERKNSSDSALEAIIPNDFHTLLKRYPNIAVLGFTGRKAFDLFQKYFKDISIETVLLPSTSAAYAAMTREAKTVEYKVFVEKFLTV